MPSPKPSAGIQPGFFLLLILIVAGGAFAGFRKPHHTDDAPTTGDRLAQLQMHRICGDRDLDAGDFAGADQEYSAMIDLFPDQPEGYGLRASIQNTLEHSSKAIDDDTKALDRMPACATACGPNATAALLIDRAKSYQRMGKSVPAIQDASAAIRLSPELPGVHLVRAEAELALKQFQPALADCNWAISHHENGQVYAYTIRGLTEYGVRHVSHMADSETSAHSIRGAIEGQMGQYAAAADDCALVIAQHPNHAEYWNDCAWYQFKAGRLTAAIATARDGLALPDVSAMEYFNLGLYYADAGDEANSQNAYETGLKYPDAATSAAGARDDIATELKAHPANPILHKAQNWLAGKP